MSCPLFEDFTRGCIERFPDFVTYTNFDLCESDNYQECPVYFVMNSKFKCKYLKSCSDSYHYDSSKFIKKIFMDDKIKQDLIFNSMKNYCLSKEKYQNCARYKFISQGRKPPISLKADGSQIKIT